jgi:hypothetical protein
MSPDVIDSLNSALASQQSVTDSIVKDITLTSPISTGLVAFNLEAPAKLIFPKMTPLRNKLPRKKGFGTSHRIKVINAISGSETGANDILPALPIQPATPLVLLLMFVAQKLATLVMIVRLFTSSSHYLILYHSAHNFRVRATKTFAN